MKENPHSHSTRHSRGVATIILSVTFFPFWFPLWVFAVAIAAQCDRTKECGEKLQAKFHPYRYGGFTLIELAIVLVIIGLVVGGVLVGQSLIKAAEIRAQISQVEKFQTAVNTFYGKYGALPGDMTATAAAQFGFTARAGTTAKGDGNGQIQGFYNGTSSVYNWNQNEEALFFWEDLSSAGLIEGGFSSYVDGTDVNCSSPSACSQYIPYAKIGGGNFIYVYSGSLSGTVNKNFFGISAVSKIGADNISLNGGASAVGLTVQQAYSIDMKMDDGKPTSGSVIAASLHPTSGTQNWSTNAATDNATTSYQPPPGPIPSLTITATTSIA